jgi:hypothetical protein
MSKDWEMIFSTPHLHLAEMTKALLEANEIEVVIRNNQDSFYKSIGEFELYVVNTNVIRAKYIISNTGNE